METERIYYEDDSWNGNVLYNRLLEQYNKHGLLILAYDLDDSVRPFKSLDCKDTIKIIKRCRDTLNCIFIVYTANTDMESNIKFLEDNDLPYDAINDYPDNFPISKFSDDFRVARESEGGIPKLYYNILLDDKSCGLREACEILDLLCDEIENVNKAKKEQMKEKLRKEF